MSKPSNLMIKMFYKHYDNGEILPGRFAHQLNEESYLIFKQDQTTLEVRIGEQIPNAGRVSLDHNMNLKIGRHTIIVGNDPLVEYQALPTNSKTKFNVIHKDGHKMECRVGEHLEGLGKVTQDDYGRIYVNDRNIPIFKKVYELNLIVMPTASSNGYLAFFNNLKPKDPDNRQNGIPGVFIAGSTNKPSKFQEKGPDGNLYSTCLIKPNSDGRTVRCLLRNLNDAIEERIMLSDLKTIEETEVKPYDLEPDDVQEYVELRSKISELQATMWTQREFSVTKGHRILGLGNAQQKAQMPTTERSF